MRDYIKLMWSRIVFFLLLATVTATAQSATPSTPAIDNDFVHQQFGGSCDLESKWPPMTADLNGDGIADLVMVGRCKNPLIDQDEKNFRVIDPMHAFFGYGNPKITSNMAQDDPKLKGICVLVIHGSGSEAWRSSTPQAKFVIIDLAVKTMTVRKMKLSRKKFTTAVYVEEATGDQMTSAIFWDGRKYRYSPLGSSME
jgi:hypothetical protein